MLRRTYRNANGKNFMMEVPPQPQPKKTMGDLPPEVMLIIFEHLTLNQSRNSLLSYRRVSSQWKQNLDSIIEKKIVSTELEPFPEMLTKVTGQDDLLTVYQSPATLRNDGDAFPFNSATLAKKIHNDNPTDYLHIGLTMGAYGASLTSFGLQDQAVDLTFMISILGAMPNLKLLRLSGVSLTSDFRNLGNAALPSPPPLPFLTSLYFGGSTVDRDLRVYLWLLCFYADQLVSLKLDTNLEFPALQQKQVYSETHNGHIIRFGTTSESAFGKLKELEIKLPTMDFLHFSELPVLKSLSVHSEAGLPEFVQMQDIFVMIDKCSQTLENLCLFVRGDYEKIMVLNRQFMVSGRLPPITKGLFPKLKTFAIRYPKSECEEMIVGSKFLALFPALEELQFLDCSSQYPTQDKEKRKTINEIRRRRGARTKKEIGDLKNRLVSINEWLVERRRKLFGKQDALHHGVLNLHGRKREEVELKLEMELKYDARYEKFPIFHRLAALGENVQKILVEQYLERQGIWKTCPKLIVVYVSSTEKPAGDICVIPRIDAVLTQH